MSPRSLSLLPLLVAALPACGAPPPDADMYTTARSEMVRAIAADAVETRDYLGRTELDPAVMAAMGRVPRHEFVPPTLRYRAYENRPLPIGMDQTISQPYIVALMTDLAGVGPRDVVLEIGTGSGYQAAVLAKLAAKVHSIEIVEPLGREAAARLAALGYRNVEVTIGDGYRGKPERAPFDAIVVTAGAPHVPQPLLDQLNKGGRLVIPVDRAFGQELLLFVKRDDGSLARSVVLPVRFVPLTGPGVGR